MGDFLDSLARQLGYMLSLPERSLRSLAAMAGGTTALLTETLFPEVLRGTTLYRIFVGDAQRFIVEKIAQVQREQPTPEQSADPRYLQKKMVGGALETAGLLAMHVSPLWVFAIAGDAAAGSSVFLGRLVAHLKTNGVIAQDTQVAGLTDVLVAVQDATRRSATAIDTPPLSREDLGKLADEMTASYGQMFRNVGNLLPRFEDLWTRMETLADRDNVSFERLSGVLSIDVASWGRKGIGAALAVGKTGSDLFGEAILDSYGRTLDAVAAEGISTYVSARMKPFLEAAWSHFDAGRQSWTESLVRKLFGSDSASLPEVAAEPAVEADALSSASDTASLPPMVGSYETDAVADPVEDQIANEKRKE